MQKAHKAQRRIIDIGDKSLEVVMLPDGDYRFNRFEVSKVIGETDDSLTRFCQGRNDVSFEVLEVENELEPFIAVPIELVCFYWFKCAEQGNQVARTLWLNLLMHSSKLNHACN